MWTYFYNKYGNLSNEENFENCLSTMVRYRRIKLLNPDPKRIRREFMEGEPTYGRLFSLIHEHHAEQMGKVRWGDKSLRSERYAKEILSEFPEAKIIHIIRDPRDRYASVMKRYEVNRSQVGGNTGRWLYSAKLGERNHKKYPNNYLVMRYESLAFSPEYELQKVCDFIDELYTPEMLSMNGAPDHRDQGGNSSFNNFEPGQISKNPIGRFRNVLSKEDIAFMQIFTEGYLKLFEYDLEVIDFNFQEQLSFSLKHLPQNIVRMVGWRVMEMAKQVRGVHVPEYHLTDYETDSQLADSISQSS
jgi:hypothetical protein